MRNIRHTHKTRLLYVLGGLLLACGLAFALIHAQPRIFTHNYKPRISAKMSVERTYLIDKFQPLGIQIGQPSPAECAWNNDGSLDSFDCRSFAPVMSPAFKVSDTASIMQKLATIDASLQKDGWHIFTNDFRNQKPWATPEQMLQSGGINIAYAKDKNEDVGCSLQAPIRVTVEDSRFWTFECGKSKQFWLLQTPYSCWRHQTGCTVN